MVKVNSLLHGEEIHGSGYAGYQETLKRPHVHVKVTWHEAMRPRKIKALNNNEAVYAMIDKVEKNKSRIRVKVEYPFCVNKRQLGFVNVRYRCLKKNTVLVVTLFALSNLWMMHGKLMGERDGVLPGSRKMPCNG